VAQQLFEQGLDNVHILYGGFDAWKQAGYPLESK
jgi:rhodanese-related sulfurtransferase